MHQRVWILISLYIFQFDAFPAACYLCVCIKKTTPDSTVGCFYSPGRYHQWGWGLKTPYAGLFDPPLASKLCARASEIPHEVIRVGGVKNKCHV